MSVTGAITLSSSTCKTGQPVTVTCTLTNGGSSDVQLVSMVPMATSVSPPLAMGMPLMGGASTMSIAASGGTLKKSWTVVPNAPGSSYGLAQPASLAYLLSAEFRTSDGTEDVATNATLTVGYAGT